MQDDDALRLAAAAMGRKGGRARANRQTKAQRIALAKLAAKARWAKHKKAAA